MHNEVLATPKYSGDHPSSKGKRHAAGTRATSSRIYTGFPTTNR